MNIRVRILSAALFSTLLVTWPLPARSGFVSDTDATQVVDFSRAFRLSGSPNG